MSVLQKEITRSYISNILKDYYWMINSIKLERDSLRDVGGNFTAKYGDESSMPKAVGMTSDPVFNESVRREKRWEKIHRYENKVKIIQERLYLINEERELEVLHLLLDGKSYSWIARHMGLSERHIRRIKDSITEKMSEMPSLPN